MSEWGENTKSEIPRSRTERLESGSWLRTGRRDVVNVGEGDEELLHVHDTRAGSLPFAYEGAPRS